MAQHPVLDEFGKPVPMDQIMFSSAISSSHNPTLMDKEYATLEEAQAEANRLNQAAGAEYIQYDPANPVKLKTSGQMWGGQPIYKMGSDLSTASTIDYRTFNSKYGFQQTDGMILNAGGVPVESAQASGALKRETAGPEDLILEDNENEMTEVEYTH